MEGGLWIVVGSTTYKISIPHPCMVARETNFLVAEYNTIILKSNKVCLCIKNGVLLGTTGGDTAYLTAEAWSPVSCLLMLSTRVMA